MVVGAPSRYGVNEAPSVTDWVAPAVAASVQTEQKRGQRDQRDAGGWACASTHGVSS